MFCRPLSLQCGRTAANLTMTGHCRSLLDECLCASSQNTGAVTRTHVRTLHHTSYSFLQTLDRAALEKLAEPVTGLVSHSSGFSSTAELSAVARDLGVAIGAGLVERDGACALLIDTLLHAPYSDTHSHTSQYR
jgi:hypothetical protein